MSTRANVIIKDEFNTIYFYRHSDGYPEVTGESLTRFVKGYEQSLMRMDAMQSAGWLVLHGHDEYREGPYTGLPGGSEGYGWKVGAYEPCQALQGDVEYVYVIDLGERRLRAYEPSKGFWDDPSFEKLKPCAEFAEVRF